MLEKLLDKIAETVFHDRLLDLRGQPMERANIMDGKQSPAEDLVRRDQMANVGFRVISAAIAVSSLFDGRKVFLIFRIAKVQVAG